jgi:hypothetical protein
MNPSLQPDARATGWMDPGPWALEGWQKGASRSPSDDGGVTHPHGAVFLPPARV